MFMDMSREEFAEQMLTLQPAQRSESMPYLGRFERTGAVLPDAIDWVEQGAVSAVKNQGTCGSWWAATPPVMTRAAKVVSWTMLSHI